MGSGSLSYQAREYSFDVRGLGVAGIGAAPIQANGEIYGLERVGDVSGAFVRAAQNNVGGLWLRNKNGVMGSE